jgi:hypothetical protein
MAVRTHLRLAAVAAVVVLPLTAAAQGGGGPGGGQQQPLQNLQYFPKDMTRPQLTQIMRGFAMSLGVRCEFCHVEREGATAPPGGAPPLNYAADDKDTKKQARYMLRMVDSINNKLLAGLPMRDNPPTTIGCYTCHRGVSKPTTIEAVLTTTTNEAGVDSAISRYKTLRNDMASGRYNFSEQPVIEVARQLAAANKGPDAIKLLEMLQEFYPNSQQIDFEVGGLQERAGNKDAAIARYRAALQKNPNDRRAQAALTRLGAQP